MAMVPFRLPIVIDVIFGNIEGEGQFSVGHGSQSKYSARLLTNHSSRTRRLQRSLWPSLALLTWL